MESLRFCLFAFLLPSCCLIGNEEIDFPFQSGETLTYDLKWGIFPVGSATMKAQTILDENETRQHRLTFSVRTNDFADAFYKVRTNITSVIDHSFKRSLRYEKSQREGKTKREIEVMFDYDSKKAKYHESNRLVSTMPIPEQVFDPLAIAYFFRLKELKPNTETILPTCDGKKFQAIKVRAGAVEKVRVPAGTFQAIGTIPEMKNLSGVFKKSPKGILRVWYSKDFRRIPVKISSKVVVGSFTARLTEAKGLKKK
jgi:hypothetical protein